MSLISVMTLIVASVALTSAAPQGMYFYRSSPYSNYPSSQHAMYMQLYSQPLRAQQPSRVSSYVSGNSVRTGSYIKDAEYFKRKVNGRLHSVSSVAEAYPESEPELLHDEIDIPEDEIHSDVPVEHSEHDDVPSYDAPAPADEKPIVQLDPVAPSKPKEKKKTTVQVSLDTPQNDDDDDDDYSPRRGSGMNTYFPIRFGNTNGGAIAIANAFSNGKGGTAASRATAYGNPKKSSPRTSK